MTTTDATVVIVDDDPLIRRGVTRLLTTAGYSVKAFSSPAEFLDFPLAEEPTCIVLDMCMEGMTGLEVQEILKTRDRDVPVILLSGHGTVSAAAASFKHGAADFLEKPVQPKQLLSAVSAALERDRRHSAKRSELTSFRQLFEELTPREQEVLRLVVSGRLNKQAAAELGISEKTVKVHRARVMEKMHVDSLAALVLIAERIGLTPEPAALVGEAPATWIY